MPSVKLNANQFKTFKELGLYILHLQQPDLDLNSLNESVKHEYIGKLSNYGERTIRNKFSESQPIIRQENFLAFSENFVEFHHTHSDPNSDLHLESYKLFTNWVNEICNKVNWQNPLSLSKNNSNKGSRKSNANLEELVSSTVNRFYSAVQNSEFKEAWSLLSPENQNTKGGDYNAFKKRYKSLELKEHKIFETFKISDNTFECQVGYLYKDWHVNSDLDTLSTITIGKADKLFEVLPEIINKMKISGIKYPEKILLNTLFVDDPLLRLADVFGIDLYAFFEKPTGPFRKEQIGYDLCLCEFKNDRCLIGNIRKTKSSSHPFLKQYDPDHVPYT